MKNKGIFFYYYLPKFKFSRKRHKLQCKSLQDELVEKKRTDEEKKAEKYTRERE